MTENRQNDLTDPQRLPLNARLTLISNPQAGRVAELIDSAVEVLEERGFDVHSRQVDGGARRLREVVAEERRQADCVVLGGGDGTLHQALPALVGDGAPIGVLPLGTANDLARTLGISLVVEEAAAALAGGRIRWIDVGEADGRYFLNVAHVGLGVAARDALSRETKRRWRSLSYPLALMTGLKRHRAFSARICVDGDCKTLKVSHLGVGNGRYFGGGIPVAAEATVWDGRLDVYAVRARGVMGLVRAGFSVWRGERGPALWRAGGEQVEIWTRRPHTLMADGETIGQTPVTIRVRKAMVPVVVPGEPQAAAEVDNAQE